MNAGIDVDDLLQATFEGILRRNKMDSAFNPKRGGLPNYVVWVARSVLSHLIAVRQRHPLVNVVEPGDRDEDIEAWPQLTGSFLPMEHRLH